MFLAAVFALVSLALVRLLSRTGIGAPVAQVAEVLTVALLVIGGWLLATSRLSREGRSRWPAGWCCAWCTPIGRFWTTR